MNQTELMYASRQRVHMSLLFISSQKRFFELEQKLSKYIHSLLTSIHSPIPFYNTSIKQSYRKRK